MHLLGSQAARVVVIISPIDNDIYPVQVVNWIHISTALVSFDPYFILSTYHPKVADHLSTSFQFNPHHPNSRNSTGNHSHLKSPLLIPSEFGYHRSRKVSNYFSITT